MKTAKPVPSVLSLNMVPDQSVPPLIAVPNNVLPPRANPP